MSSITCLDCGLNYDTFPLDVVLTRIQWLLLNPLDGGVLCANCIVSRAARLPQVINLSCSITFASDYDKRPPLERLAAFETAGP